MLEQSCGSVRIFWLDYENILNSLQKKIALVNRYPEIVEVWLFGSIAEVKAVPGSDVDILLIIDKSDVRFVDRIERYQDLFSGIGIGIDIFPYAREESESTLAKIAREKGICLYQRDEPDIGKNALNLLKLAVANKRSLRRTDPSIVI